MKLPSFDPKATNSHPFFIGVPTLSPLAAQAAGKGICPRCHTKTLTLFWSGRGMAFHLCSSCKDAVVLSAAQKGNTNMIPCPVCYSRGTVFLMVSRTRGGNGAETINCRLCDGKGELDDGFPSRREIGDQMRRERIARGESLFAAAERLGITSTQLSDVEIGKKSLGQVLAEHEGEEK